MSIDQTASRPPRGGSNILMAAYTNYRRDPRVRREAECLVEAGYKVVFLALHQAGEPSRETIAGVQVVKLSGIKNRRTSIAAYIVDYLIFGLKIFMHTLVRPRHYALIHINNMPDFLVFAAWLPRLLGTPVVHDVHDLMPELFQEKFRAGERHWLVGLLKTQERWAAKFASAVITVEGRLRDILADRGVPRGKIHLLMNLPDDRMFPARTVLAKPAGAPFVLVYHGTLARRLGLDIAIRAVGLARARIERIQFRIIGDGEERATLLSLASDLDLNDVVTFSGGFVPVELIAGLIDDADVGVIPLRISSGTDIMLPTKLLEYALLGIPCIAPKTGTIARYFDEEMVQYFQAESAESLCKSIVELHGDPTKRLRLAKAATARFASKYKWSQHKRVYEDLVAELISAS